MIDTTNRNTSLASALVEELSRCGVRRAFLSPGSRSSPIALALDREPEIELTVILDERVSGFAALGAAIGGGVPTVVACTSGSAAANLHPAVVEADQAGVPLILLTSDRPPELRGIGAGQTIDQIGLYGSAARWFCEVGTHEADDAGLLHLRSIACRAYGEAVASRGPVHLNLSWRDPLGPDPSPGDLSATEPLAVEGRSEGRPLTVPIDANEPGEELLAALAQAAAGANRGLIVVGRLTDHRISGSLAELSELTGFPILAEPTSQLRFGRHDRAGVISAYDLIARSQPEALNPDLVLRFGDMPTSKPMRAWLGACGADQIVIDPPGRWNEPTHRAGAFVRADALAIIDGIRDRINPGDGSWRELWGEVERTAQKAIDDVLATSSGLSEPAIQRLLGDAYSNQEQILLASSMPIRDAEAFLRGGDADLSFHANRGANGIDGLVSTGCGIGLVSGQPTWIVLGDLALVHDIGGLVAARSLKTSIRIVVIDNGGGGIFDFLPQAGQVEVDRFERLFTTPSALDMERVASLFDLPYERISDQTQLLAIGERERVLAHIKVDRTENVALHRRIADAVTNAISR
jgi:2-succinyl-5-enolpyruvyl-6-hydroxy-3-cyclohexene-1-carboxylate synthase